MAAAWLASAFLCKPAQPPPLLWSLPNGAWQLAQHSHLCLSPKRSFRGAVEDHHSPALNCFLQLCITAFKENNTIYLHVEAALLHSSPVQKAYLLHALLVECLSTVTSLAASHDEDEAKDSEKRAAAQSCAF